MLKLGQRGRNVSWYSPEWEAEFARVDADASGQAWARLLQRERIGHVILDERRASAALRAGLAIAGARKTDEAAASHLAYRGGRQGKHTEELGYVLAEMQFLPRAYPGATW